MAWPPLDADLPVDVEDRDSSETGVDTGDFPAGQSGFHADLHNNANQGVRDVRDRVVTHEADTTAAHAASAISFTPTGTVAATDVQAAIAEVASEGSHPDLAAHDTLGLATQADLDGHAAAADPHTGYQRESEKDVANGYAGLDASGLVPDARVAASIARDSEVTAAVSTHEAAADPHTGYLKEADFDANTILKADADNTPTALTVAEQTLVGRITGGTIDDLSVAQILTLLGRTDEEIQDLVGAMVSGNTETGITVTYDDTNGKFDFTVSGAGYATVQDEGSGLTARTVLNLVGGALRGVDDAANTRTKVEVAAVFPRHKTGFYYGPSLVAGVGAAAIANKLIAVPFFVGFRQTFDRVGLRISTAAAATTVRLGLYSDDGGGYPGSLIVDAGTVDSSATGWKEIVISQTLDPGLYWLAAVAQGGTPSWNTLGTAAVMFPHIVSSTATLPSAQNHNGYQQTGVTAGLPDPFTTTVTLETGSAVPWVGLRAA